MGINSYRKGYLEERRIADELAQEFPEARIYRSGTQESSKFVSGDVVAANHEHLIADCHLEVHHAKNPNLLKKWDKTQKDAKAFKSPVLIFKQTSGVEGVMITKAYLKRLWKEIEGFRNETKVGKDDFLTTKLK